MVTNKKWLMHMELFPHVGISIYRESCHRILCPLCSQKNNFKSSLYPQMFPISHFGKASQSSEISQVWNDILPHKIQTWTFNFGPLLITISVVTNPLLQKQKMKQIVNNWQNCQTNKLYISKYFVVTFQKTEFLRKFAI